MVSPLRDLIRFKDYRTRRISSWDRTGGNLDFIRIPREETVTIADIKGAGCITHIWFTVNCRDRDYLRKTLIRMYWDGEEDPSVDSPLGDFFGIGHGVAKPFQSLPLNMTGGTGMKGDRSALNSYWQMPFAKSAKIEIVNECYCAIDSFYYQIDYEEYGKLEDKDILRFHAKWRRENPCHGVKPEGEDIFKIFIKNKNLRGKENYIILEAEGRGHYAGCILNVDNLEVGEKAPKFRENPFEWWGEGDDMIFIDGEEKPSIVGTGSEDYFTHAWGMQDKAYLYAGSSLHEYDPNFKRRRKCTSYRFHIEDPVRFKKSIKVTIEHGHANTQSNDYSSVAYWYQTEPHKPWAPMPKVEERLPRPDPYDSLTPEERALEKEINQMLDDALNLMWGSLEKKGYSTQLRQIFASSFMVNGLLRKKEYEKAKELANQTLENARKLPLS